MNSVILVGMPGAGKSTLGIQLAKALALDFVDTDVLIQLREHCTLQHILDTQGYLKLREIEAQVLQTTDLPEHVIATGGSAVYCDAAMTHLKRFGTVVYLDVALDELRRRIHDYETRGIAMQPGQSFAALFDERRILYRRYADIVIDCGDKNQEQLLGELVDTLSEA